jgi:methionyl-tRNA formyltransferase
VKKVALQHGITVFDSSDDAMSWMQTREMAGVTGVVVAYGRIIKDPLLSALPLVNLHFSELPRWRGAAPVERAILAGDKRTAASIMQIEEGLDTGAVYAMESADIHDGDDVTTLRERLADLGARSLVTMLQNGFPAPRVQEGEPVHADKITVDDLRIDWDTSAVEIHRTVRLGEAFTSFRGQDPSRRCRERGGNARSSGGDRPRRQAGCDRGGRLGCVASGRSAARGEESHVRP